MRRTPASALTLLFLRRFAENDVLSPNADRHAALSMSAAVFISLGLFLTTFLSIKYLFGIQLPGTTAMWALQDRTFYIAASMLTAVVIGAVVWDSLGLEARDIVILGPLPIRSGTILVAKLAALVWFAVLVAPEDCALQSARQQKRVHAGAGPTTLSPPYASATHRLTFHNSIVVRRCGRRCPNGVDRRTGVRPWRLVCW